jgi:hypothetical protein
MARSRKPEPKQADWPPDKTLRHLRQQLDELQKLKGRNYQEAEHEEEAWTQFTVNVFIHGFGEASQNLSNLHSARWAGEHNMMGISDFQAQRNFELRVQKFEVTLSSSIKELEAMLPEAEVRGAYEAGDEYAFYEDLKGILAAAAHDVFVVDNYLDTQFFELYVHPIGPGVAIRILTDQVRGNLMAVANKYATRGNLELRSSAEVHDRHVFVDGRGWMIGQSIKDAARRKPTYMVEIGAALIPTVRQTYEDIWQRATVVVKG